VVEQAWTSVLGKSSFVKNVPWEEAGGDSLNGLRLWFYLEQGLSVRFPLETLREDMTPRMLIAGIEKDLSLSGRKFDLGLDRGRLPLVFLMPTALGDLPGLARFRAALEDAIRFVTIRYPSWSEMIDAGSRFDVLIKTAVGQILAECDDDIYLLGHSFGGFVAFEAARRITELGRRVSFIGLIDTRRERRRRVAQIVRRNLGILPRTFWRAMAVLLPPNAAFKFQLRLEQQLRYGALEKWGLKPLNSPVTLFRSGDRDSDYGWSALCNHLSIIPIGGDHDSVLELPYRDTLCARFLRAVNEANARVEADPSLRVDCDPMLDACAPVQRDDAICVANK
jgi:thioesterase domain-containing protein